MSLFEELKRRNVIRVGVAYVVAAWVAAQVADLVLENIGAPDWVIQTLLFLLALGFVAALIIAWAYEVTPEGIKRESEVDRSVSVTEQTGQRLNIITIGLVVVALGVFAFDRLSPAGETGVASSGTAAANDERRAGGSPDESKPAPVAASGRSIAVLPFVALSVDENDAFFGKGIAEELLNALAQFADLKVAARTSAFSFDGKDVDLREVGQVLGVAHVLEGSVRRSGDRLRITAQLIRTSDGFHLWSDTYERTMTDIFEIQDEIVAELARVLQFRLGVGVGAGRAANMNVDPRAYELYLQGLELWWTRDIGDNRTEAIKTFRRVTTLDPDFADAWAAYGASLSLSPLWFAPFLSTDTFKPEVDNAYARALAIAPDNARAHAGLAFWHTYGSVDVEKAEHHLERALELSPNSSFTRYAAANFYLQTGDHQRAIDQFDRAIALDPLNLTVQRVRVDALMGLGRDVDIPDALREQANCDGDVCPSGTAFNNVSLLMATLARGREPEIARYVEAQDSLQERLASPMSAGMEDHVQMILAFARHRLGEAVDTDFWSRVDETREFHQMNPWLSCSILARFGQQDTCASLLRTAYDRSHVFPFGRSIWVLLPGPFEMPDNVRRDPEYHALWSLPGMPELAARRRANGIKAGLPLPVGY